ncbi:MAG: hypothetical protein P1V51_02815 [Deltaproteobacteria bacterium]|nr:hypothetical protein [Deltaproteobacteria bacterium]
MSVSNNSTACTNVQPLAFLDALFEDLDGVIEVRILGDSAGAVVHRRWFDSAEDLVEDLPALTAMAESAGAGIFFGVLPRGGTNQSRAEHALPGRVVWADLDFDKYEGGEEEARVRLHQVPYHPVARVHSGHGLHAYWLLNETRSPEELVAFSQTIRRILGSDAVADAARIMRLPGSVNRKDPDNPVETHIEIFESYQHFNPEEFREALEETAPMASERPQHTSSPPPPVEYDDELPAEVARLMVEDNKLRNLFRGRGKTGRDRQGNPLDESSSGYDFSLALHLIEAGITEPLAIGTTIACRPDGAALAKGDRYIARTVARALEAATAAEEDDADVEVDAVTIYESDPVVVLFEVEGRTFEVNASQLATPTKFRERFINAVHRVPTLQKGHAWTEWVNSVLENAERVEQPPEASTEAALREAVQDFISGLPDSDEPTALDSRIYSQDREQFISLKIVLDGVKEDHDVTRTTLAATMRGLGHTGGHRIRVEVEGQRTRQVRAWRLAPGSNRSEATESPEPVTDAGEEQEAQPDEEQADQDDSEATPSDGTEAGDA